MQYAQKLRGSTAQRDHTAGMIALAVCAFLTLLTIALISLTDPDDRFHPAGLTRHAD
jgi:hypothetical protein